MLAVFREKPLAAKGREPTKDETTELVEGTGKVLKTVF
jgi:hypothetical protein